MKVSLLRLVLGLGLAVLMPTLETVLFALVLAGLASAHATNPAPPGLDNHGG